MIDAVIFDWGGTLTPWHSVDLLEQWRAYARVATPDDVEVTAAAILAAEEAAWGRARDHHTSTTTEAVLAAAGFEVDEVALAAYHEWWTPHTYLDPDGPQLFSGLRERGIRIGVLSNTFWSRSLHESVFARDGVLDLIDGAVYTSEIPWTKPHPEAFNAALAAVGVDDPTRAVFVGDRPFDDIHGAKSVGMRTVLVPHSTVPAHDVHPDATVQRLGDVLGVVDDLTAQA